MKQKNYYEILGVNKRSTLEEIKLNYRKLAKEYHPDANIDNKDAEEIFKDLNTAYDTLTDKEKRKVYNRQVSKYGYGNVVFDETFEEIKQGGKSSGTIVNEIMQTILGFSKGTKDKVISAAEDATTRIQEKIAVSKEPKKGENIETTIYVTLEEAFFGTEKKISLKTIRGGQKNYSVNVPMGIRDGERIRLSGLGKPGKNEGKNGDLIILVKLRPHAMLRLDGADVLMKLDISPAQAVIGDNVQVKIFGEKVLIQIPRASKDKDKIEILGKGYVVNEITRGNLIVELNLNVPKDLTERETKLYQQILKIEKQHMKISMSKSGERV